MISEIRFIFNLLDSRSRKLVIFFGFLRVGIGLLDLVGVLLVGLILAKLASGFSSTGANSQLGTLSGVSVIRNMSIVEIALIAAVAFIVKAIGTAVIAKTTYKTLALAESKIAIQAFKYSLLNMSLIAKKYSKSDLNYLMTTSSGAIVEILSGIIIVISETALLISILITFLTVDYRVTLFIVIYFTFIAITLNYFMGNRLRKYALINTHASLATTSILFDSLTAYREIKSLRREEYFLNRFSRAKTDFSYAGGQSSFLGGVPRYVVESALMIGTLALVGLAYNANDVVGSAQSIGIFITGGLKITASMLPLQSSFVAYKTLRVRANLLIDFMKSVPTQELKISKNSISTVSGPVGVTTNDLEYFYSGATQYALSEINLHIEPGQMIALIGPSGSGKSTLADLLLNIEKPTEGTIHYYNEKGESVLVEDFNIGYVAQNPGIISGSIKDNIALGLSDNEIDKAILSQSIEDAHLSELVSELEEGIDTDLGKQSDSLSGGQLQRIGLARALYAKPNLLVLDEATSALDAESESAVTQSLNRLKGTCTIVVIAHRLSTVQNADVVYVIESGKIVAQGKFKDLAKSNDLVSRYVELSEIKK